MRLQRPPARALLQRVLGTAPVLVMLAWGIATAVGAGDSALDRGGVMPDIASGPPSLPLDRAPAARQAQIEMAVGLPSERPFFGELDWDSDVSDFVEPAVPEPEQQLPAEVAVGFAARPSRSHSVDDPTLENPLRIVNAGEIGRGESLAYLLARQGVRADKVSVVAREMSSVFNFRHAQPGDRYRLAQDPDGNVVDFRYSTDDDSTLHLFRDGEGYTVQQEATEFVSRVVSIAGMIETSLYSAIRLLGEDPLLANDFAALFAWDVDFTRNIRSGDDFRILYERLYRVDADDVEHYVRPGRILAARFRGAAGEFTALYFEEDDGRGGYFRPDGRSVEREFLVSPLEYGRITSSWSQARRHPILKVTRPHHGIDYAAPAGTPVWSVAEGTVIYRGWGGGFGNLIKVRHVNGYVSYYAHLSRFAKGLEVGTRVVQKQVIGSVGSTGLATGAHVCFRIAKNGHYVNPLTLESAAGKPIPKSRFIDFKVVRDSLLSDLDVRHLASVAEAL